MKKLQLWRFNKISILDLSDYAGTKINHLTAIKQGDDYISKDGKHRTRWWYKCDCQNNIPEENQKLKLLIVSRVKSGQFKSCGCKQFRYKRMPEDLKGRRFGKLIADHIVNKPTNIKTEGTYWFCKCDCGGSNIVRCSDLKRLHNTSCGQCQINKYNLSGKYGIGYTSNNEAFYFDLEDYELIKPYTWNINSDGYVFAFNERLNGKQKYVYMHRLIVGLDENDEYIVDHRYHKKNDNRKEQLRVTTVQNNNRNSMLAKNNTSSVTGVSWFKLMNQWRATITVDYKNIIIGYSPDFNEAVIMRKQAEEKYFGEYSYDNSIKEACENE